MSAVFPESPLSSPPATATPGQAAPADVTMAKLAIKLTQVLDENTGLRGDLDACRQNNAAIAVQLNQYRNERDEARSAFAKLAGHFSQGKQSGWSARISGSVLRRLCVVAGVEPPDGSGEPDEGARFQVAEAREALARWDQTISGDTLGIAETLASHLRGMLAIIDSAGLEARDG